MSKVKLAVKNFCMVWGIMFLCICILAISRTAHPVMVVATVVNLAMTIYGVTGREDA